MGCGVSPVGLQHIADTLCNPLLTCNITKLTLSDNEQVFYIAIMCIPDRAPPPIRAVKTASK